MGVTYLLDTHILLWWVDGFEQIPRAVADEIGDRNNRVLISAASAFEIATKVRAGRLPQARPLIEAWTERISQLGFTELEVSSRHALLAGRLEWDHRDPFDRLLVAQSTSENATLVTTDRAITAVEGLSVLSWN